MPMLFTGRSRPSVVVGCSTGLRKVWSGGGDTPLLLEVLPIEVTRKTAKEFES